MNTNLLPVLSIANISPPPNQAFTTVHKNSRHFMTNSSNAIASTKHEVVVNCCELGGLDSFRSRGSILLFQKHFKASQLPLASKHQKFTKSKDPSLSLIRTW